MVCHHCTMGSAHQPAATSSADGAVVDGRMDPSGWGVAKYIGRAQEAGGARGGGQQKGQLWPEVKGMVMSRGCVGGPGPADGPGEVREHGGHVSRREARHEDVSSQHLL